MNRSIMWARIGETGLEHLHISRRKDKIIADGLVLLKEQDVPLRVHYTVRCNTNWIAREVYLYVVGLAGTRRQPLISDGTGHWFRGSHRLAALDGCLDVDINLTPFTNTLPIRRLALKPDESAEISVVYLSVPELHFQPARQRYTCLDLTPEGGRYRYESLSTGFTRDITVDADGLVIDYPGIWRRV